MVVTKLMRSCKQFHGSINEFSVPNKWAWRELNRQTNPSFIRTLSAIYVGNVEIRREKLHVFEIPSSPGAPAKEKFTSVVYYVAPHGSIRKVFLDALIHAVTLADRVH